MAVGTLGFHRCSPVHHRLHHRTSADRERLGVGHHRDRLRGLAIRSWHATMRRIIFGNVRYKALAIVIWLACLLQPGASLTNVALAGDKDPFAAARYGMVRDQLSGPGRAITNARVLAMMRKVPRHELVPERN